jgi:hypothetical protein
MAYLCLGRRRRAVIVRKCPRPLDAPTCELWLIPLDGSAPRRLDVDLSVAVAGQLGNIRLSLDGRQCAYVVGKSYETETWVLEHFCRRCRRPAVTAGA